MKLKIILFLFVSFIANALISQNTRKLDSLIETLSSTISVERKTSNNIEIARLCSKNGNFELGLKYGFQGLNLALKQTNKEQIAHANMYIGANYIAKSLFDSASHFYNQALIVHRMGGDSVDVSNVYNNLGLILYFKADYIGALDYYLKSLKIKEDFNDSIKISWNYNSIGALYYDLENYKLAEEYIEKGISRTKVESNVFNHLNLKGNLANIYIKTNRIKEAMNLYKYILSISINRGFDIITAETYSKLGGIYYKNKGNYSQGLAYLNKALEIFEAKNNGRERAVCYLSISECYLLSKNYTQATYYSRKAAELSPDRGVKRDAYYALYSSYRGYNSDSSLYYFEQYLFLNDSIRNEDKKIEMAKIEINYDADKKIAINNILNEKKLNEERIIQEKQNVIIYAFIIGFILILILAIFVYKNYKQKSESNRIITAQKEEVELKNVLIEEKQKEILDSIHYAKKIQHALLAHKEFVNQHIANNFIYFQPKDIVSGDFYWATKHDANFYFAVCDSTGHGVPGAFMSLLSIGFLSEAINEKLISEPNKVFNYVRKRLIDAIGNEGQQDGFDGILLCLNTKTNKVTYAAANNAPLLFRNGELKHLDYSRMPVGKGVKIDDFDLFNLEVLENDSLFLSTDGFADQFGGPKGKKFMSKNLDSLLLSIAHKNPDEQLNELTTSFKNWKGNLEQLDDVCVVGIKF